MVAALIPHFLAGVRTGCNASAHAQERRAPEFASIIERCPGILQGFPGSSERSPPRLDLCEVSFARSAKANPAVHMGSSKHELQRADSNAAPQEGAAADLRDTGTDSGYLANDKSYP